MIDKKCTAWILTEGLIGTQNQCIGIAHKLNVTPVIKHVTLKRPWVYLSPPLVNLPASSFIPCLQEPWPDILIASGRKSVAASLFIKKMSKGKTFTVHVQDPKISARYFDLVAVPFHDDMRGPNVVVTKGAPNKITSDLLDENHKKFEDEFAFLKGQKIAVLIGGSSKAYTLSSQNTQKLITQLQSISKQPDTSLMITASRRTGEENLSLLRDHLKGDNIYFWDGNGDNPYLGILAHSDVICVTADSVSMLSEAATTGKPVYIIPLDGGARRIEKFHNHLKNSNIAREFNGKIENWAYTALDDAAMVAQAVQDAYKKHKDLYVSHERSKLIDVGK